VSGFPTIKWFPAHTKTPEAYSGGRTAADMTDFINKKVGTHARIKSAPTAVTVLDPSNFDAIALDPSKDVLVEFYAPWCGHCKSLTPKYEKVALSFEGEDNVVIAKVDADAHKDLGQRYGVSGFPTIKYFPRGDKTPVDYTGGREGEDFVKFMNDKTGSQRTLGGGFTEAAGRIPELDDIAEQFTDANDAAAKTQLITKAQGVIASLSADQKSLGGVYELTMKRIMEKGAEFAATEAARLKRMIDGGNVAAKKRADFAKRRNIVLRFTEDDD